jgi:hypothetical protein
VRWPVSDGRGCRARRRRLIDRDEAEDGDRPVRGTAEPFVRRLDLHDPPPRGRGLGGRQLLGPDGDDAAGDLDAGVRIGAQVVVPARVAASTVVRRGDDHRVAVREVAQDERPLTTGAPAPGREDEHIHAPEPGDATLRATDDPHTE